MADTIFQDYKIYGPYDSGGYFKGYKFVILIHKITKKRKSKSYHTYLMEKKLNRLLDWRIEEVDHIDRNPANNDLNNLQILTPSQHHSKDGYKVIRIELICPNCQQKFTRRQSDIDSYMKNHNKTGKMCCSKECNGEQNH